MGFWQIAVDGSAINFDDYGAYVEEMQGVGVPPMNNISLDYAQADGALYQQSFAKPRTFTLQVYVPGTSLANLHALRKALFDAFKPNRVRVQSPVTLMYSGGGTRTLEIHAVYDSGLEWTTLSGFSEKFPLRFIAYDPFWYQTEGDVNLIEFTTQSTLSGANYLIQRKADGSWNKFTGGPNGSVFCMAQSIDGTLIVGGTFTSPGNRIAKFNGTSWSGYSSGMNGLVYDMKIGPDGRLYAIGSFSTPYPAITKWNSNTQAWEAVGSGMSGSAYALAFGIDRSIFLSGTLSVSGTSAYIARYDGTSWTTGSLAAYTNALAVAPNGTVYTGTSTTDASSIGQYNGTSFDAIGQYTLTSGTASVNRMLVGPDGYLYVCGSFDAIGGVAASGVARWNGVTWQALGDGLGGLVSAYALSFDDDGTLYVAGQFATAGGVGLPDSIAKWNGSIWSPIGINLPGTPDIRAIYNKNDRLTLGYNTSGSAIVPTVLSVTNEGTADCFPTLTLTGAGQVYEITNTTTGEHLYFNLSVGDSETITIDLTPGNKTFTSSFRGNIIGTISPDSDYSTFHLAPGVNTITIFSQNNAAASILPRARYWSIDGSA